MKGFSKRFFRWYRIDSQSELDLWEEKNFQTMVTTESSKKKFGGESLWQIKETSRHIKNQFYK